MGGHARILAHEKGASITLHHSKSVGFKKNGVHADAQAVSLQAFFLIPVGGRFAAMQDCTLVNGHISGEAYEFPLQVYDDVVRKELNSVVGTALHVAVVEDEFLLRVPPGFVVLADDAETLGHGGDQGEGIPRLPGSVPLRNVQQFLPGGRGIDLLAGTGRRDQKDKGAGQRNDRAFWRLIGISVVPARHSPQRHRVMDSHSEARNNQNCLGNGPAIY